MCSAYLAALSWQPLEMASDSSALIAAALEKGLKGFR